jgi:glycosyltransferase involved in cell wall biosynthesis
VDEWFDQELLPQVEELHRREVFDTVLIEYVFLSKLTAVIPQRVRTVIDTHDVMGDRHRHYTNAGLQPTWFATRPQEEIRALNRADAVIAIQEEEAEHLRRHISGEVFCVGHLSSSDPMPLSDPGGARLLFVGSTNPINIQGLEWFVSSILPEIRRRVPDCQLAIAGPAGHERSWPSGVSVLGSLESLHCAYAQATLVVNPVMFGTGLAVKTIEALGYGKPVVATAAGLRGLGSNFAKAVSLAQDAQCFAKMVIELLEDPAARTTLSQNAVAAMREWHSRQLANLDAAVTGRRDGY